MPGVKKSLLPNAKPKAAAAPPAEEPQTALVAEVVEEKDDGLSDWQWTPERQKAVDMLAAGIPIVQVARDCSVHRNTVRNWMARPEFVAELQRRERERIEATEQRRHVETGRLTDRVSRILHKNLDDLEKEPNNPFKLEMFAKFGKEYRAWRNEERQDNGTADGNKQEHKHLHVHAGAPGQPGGAAKATQHLSFRKFVQNGMQKLTPAQLMSATSPQDLVKEVLREQLLSGNLLDQLDEEDRAAAEAEENGR